MVEGVKTVKELVRSPIAVKDIYTTEHFDWLESVDPNQVFAIKERELTRISGLKNPNRILAVAQIPESKEVDFEQPDLLLLDGVRDPGNLGTIIRTAKWFGITELICSEDCADAYDRKVVQSAMGALFRINLTYADLSTVLPLCKQKGYQIVGAAMGGSSVYELPSPKKTALIIGSESHGMSAQTMELCDVLVTIPNNETEQTVESLNAAIATSILLSELTRPR